MNKTLVSISTAVTAAALCIAVPAASAAPLNNAQSIPADLSSQQPKNPKSPRIPTLHSNPPQMRLISSRFMAFMPINPSLRRHAKTARPR